jgi:hypothetical protein
MISRPHLYQSKIWRCLPAVMTAMVRASVLIIRLSPKPYFSLFHSDFSAVVDIFNAATGQWTTASLSAARSQLAAASLPEQGLAIFAGGTASSGEMSFS